MILNFILNLLLVLKAVDAVDKFPVRCDDKNNVKDETGCSRPESEADRMEIMTTSHIVNNQRNPDRDSFFVITTIFNPASYQQRYTLYHNFAQHMKDTGAQLITIECIFPRLNQTEFQVTQPNNPFHIQLKSDSVYWMKENLINIAVSRLPSHAKWVAWLDADISFHGNNWIDLTIQALDKYSVVQVFEKREELGPAGEILNIRLSFAYCRMKEAGRSRDPKCPRYSPPGIAWATSIPTFKLINGLPETGLVGSGDAHFAYYLINKTSFIQSWTRKLNPEYKKLIHTESEDIVRKLSTLLKPILGYVPVTVRHHWHGSKRNRKYVERWEILRIHDFNFAKDVKKTSEGLLVLAHKEISLTNGTRRTLQDDIINYFRQRNEYSTGQRKYTVRRKN